jgi:hypothetical protein
MKNIGIERFEVFTATLAVDINVSEAVIASIIRV